MVLMYSCKQTIQSPRYKALVVNIKFSMFKHCDLKLILADITFLAKDFIHMLPLECIINFALVSETLYIFLKVKTCFHQLTTQGIYYIVV